MFRAEDEAVQYLGKYSPEVALAVARNVEEELAIKWKREQREVMSRGRFARDLSDNGTTFADT
jgi:hypothetical protein